MKEHNNKAQDLGLLFLRVSIGLLMFLSLGLTKLTQIGTPETANFVSLMGIAPKFIHLMSAITEGVASILIALGIFTRFSAGLLAIAMLSATYVSYSVGTFYEHPLLFAFVFISLVLTGGGKYSIDENIRHRLPFFLKYFC